MGSLKSQNKKNDVIASKTTKWNLIFNALIIRLRIIIGITNGQSKYINLRIT